jgi:hypothetical protein
MGGYIHRQQDDLISLLLFFQMKVTGLKIRDHAGCAAGWKSVHIKSIFSQINHEFLHVNIRMLKNIVISRPSEVLRSEDIDPRIVNFDTK